MASLIATALGMGTLFSAVRRHCKRRRKKRSEWKGSVLIAVGLKQSTGGGRKRGIFQVKFEPSLLSATSVFSVWFYRVKEMLKDPIQNISQHFILLSFQSSEGE